MNRIRSQRAAIVIAMALTIVIGARPSAAAESPVGKWNTVDDKSGKVTSEVQVYDQGGKLYGKIISIPAPNDAAGKPKTCTKCQGADKDQPIVGLVIIKDLAPDGDRYKGGTILDPDDGKIYKSEVWQEGDKLKVRGSVGPFFKTQTWVKGK